MANEKSRFEINGTSYDLHDAKAVKFDRTQSLTAAQKQKARENIGAGSDDEKLDKANVYNGPDKTEAGYALDARQGKALNDSIAQQSANIGIVETGTTCTHTGGIAAGQYVIWQGALYTADAAISVGETLASSGGNKNLTACPNGGLNALINNTVINITGDFPATLIKTGNVVNCCFSVKLNSNYNAGASLFLLPSGYRPIIAQMPMIGTKVSGSSVSIARYWLGENSNYLVTGQAAQTNDYLQFYGTWIVNS